MKKKIVIIGILSVLIDQLTKIFVSTNFNLYERKKIIDNFFDLTYVRNQGAAWSILDGKVPVLIIITVVALFFIIRFIWKDNNIRKIDAINYGMLLGGIIGNFIDRVVHGYVIDFFAFTIFKYNFPVFNIADSLIVISVVLMVITSFRGDKNENSSR